MTKGAEKANGDSIEAASDAVATAQFQFPLTVTPSDAARMMLIVEQLKQDITRSGGTNPKATLIEQFFSLPAQSVRPEWVALMQLPNVERMTRGDILDRLYLNKDADAADLLAETGLASDVRLDTEGERTWRGNCVSILKDIYKRADAPLKKHIEALYVRYTGKGYQKDAKFTTSERSDVTLTAYRRKNAPERRN